MTFVITAKLLKQGYRPHKLRESFSKFHCCHYELTDEYNTSLKKHLQQGISEPKSFGDLVYKVKKTVGKPKFSDQFEMTIISVKRKGKKLYVRLQD